MRKAPPVALTNVRAGVHARVDRVRGALLSWLTVGWLCVPVACGASASAPVGGTAGASDSGTSNGNGDGAPRDTRPVPRTGRFPYTDRL
jgi:hypothetical protein